MGEGFLVSFFFCVCFLQVLFFFFFDLLLLFRVGSKEKRGRVARREPNHSRLLSSSRF